MDELLVVIVRDIYLSNGLPKVLYFCVDKNSKTIEQAKTLKNKTPLCIKMNWPSCSFTACLVRVRRAAGSNY